jgi:hypothetical protein
MIQNTHFIHTSSVQLSSIVRVTPTVQLSSIVGVIATVGIAQDCDIAVRL